LTLDAQSSVVQALAIRGDAIMAAGASADIIKQADAGHASSTLAGRTVIRADRFPTFMRFAPALNFRSTSELDRRTSIAEAMERIRVAAIYARPGTWLVVGGGWTPAQFANDGVRARPELTAAAPDIRSMCSSSIAPSR